MICVLDSVMSSGKSTYIRNFIRQNPDQKYIYVSLYLDEAKEVVEECNLDFHQPAEEDENGVKCLKLDSFHKLLKAGKNIASTHALFKLTTEETIEHLKKWNYTLIIDEVVQVIDLGEVKIKTLEYAQKLDLVEVDPITKRLLWKNKKDNAGNIEEFKRLKIMCKTDSVFLWESKDKRRKSVLVSIFPNIIFNYLKDVYVLTYMFDSSPMRLYFDMYNMPYEKYMIIGKETEDYKMVPYQMQDDGLEYKDRFNIYTGNKNDIGTVQAFGIDKKTGKKKKKSKSYFYLSSGWYDDATINDFERLRKNTDGYFRNDLRNSLSHFNMWTCFKGKEDKGEEKGTYQKRIEGKRYQAGFAPCNLRATDKMSHKTALAYLINVFINPVVVEFFKDRGVIMSDEQQKRYSISECLQWIWRSSIRLRDFKDKIDIYIPSSRMRHMFQNWLGLPSAD